MPDPPGQTAAEAYYLPVSPILHLTHLLISETPFFLETAIRLSPKSPIAAKAYDVLNGYILAEYTGSSGRDLAQDIQEYLEELRRLRGGS
jgi:hypothetical protein